MRTAGHRLAPSEEPLMLVADASSLLSSILFSSELLCTTCAVSESQQLSVF